MSERQTDGLDDRIRTLVARAVADAPPAPVIDEQTIADGPVVRAIGSAPSARNRWIAGGIAAMTTAAAVIAIALVARPENAEAPAPATLPPATAPAPITPVTSPSTAASTVVEGTAPPTSLPVPSTPGTAPSTTVAPPPASPEVITIAGDDGIQLDTGDAIGDVALGFSARTAVKVPDNRVFFQYRTGEPGVYVVVAGGPAPQPVAVPADFPGDPLLHDAAVVNGEVVLLVESTPAQQCTGGDGCIGSIWAIWPDRGEGVLLDEQNVWEGAWSRLSLSETGVVVGMFAESVTNSPYSLTLPGVDASAPSAESIGLEQVYTECSTCPSALTIDVTGRFVGWLERQEDGTLIIAVHSLVDGWTATNQLADTSELPVFLTLDIGAVQADANGFVSGSAIINDIDPTSAVAARVYDLGKAIGDPLVIGKPATRMAFGR